MQQPIKHWRSPKLEVSNKQLSLIRFSQHNPSRTAVEFPDISKLSGQWSACQQGGCAYACTADWWSLNNTVQVAVGRGRHAETLHGRPTQVRHRAVSAARRRIIQVLTNAGRPSALQRTRRPAGRQCTTQRDVAIQLTLTTPENTPFHTHACFSQCR